MSTYWDYLKTLKSCPLCKEKEKYILFSSDYHKVVMAIAPYVKNHLLIIPHRHIVSFSQSSNEETQDLLSLQKKVASFLYDLWHQEIIRMLRDWQETDEIRPSNSTTGKSLNHLHYHAIPDCDVTAKHLIDKETSDNRHLVTDDEIVQTREQRNTIFK